MWAAVTLSAESERKAEDGGQSPAGSICWELTGAHPPRVRSPYGRAGAEERGGQWGWFRRQVTSPRVVSYLNDQVDNQDKMLVTQRQEAAPLPGDELHQSAVGTTLFVYML